VHPLGSYCTDTNPPTSYMFRSALLPSSGRCFTKDGEIVAEICRLTAAGVLTSPWPELLHFQLFSSVQRTDGSPTEPDLENRVSDQDTGIPGRPFYSGLQVPGEPFPS
jgi:hypothetical protein